jgi:hypothetical protein
MEYESYIKLSFNIFFPIKRRKRIKLGICCKIFHCGKTCSSWQLAFVKSQAFAILHSDCKPPPAIFRYGELGLLLNRISFRIRFLYENLEALK